MSPVISTIQHVQIPDGPLLAIDPCRRCQSDGGSQGGPPSNPPNPERIGDAELAVALQPKFQHIDWNVDRDLYRRQLEALRQEVGDQWLSALGPKDLGVPRTGTGLNDSTRIPTDSIPRACNNQAILSGGHT